MITVASAPVRLFLLLVGALLGLVLLVGGDCGPEAHADGGAERWDLDVGGPGIIKPQSWRACQCVDSVGGCEACILVLGVYDWRQEIQNTSGVATDNKQANLFFPARPPMPSFPVCV